jgi:iron complex outermembrane receptor protein
MNRLRAIRRALLVCALTSASLVAQEPPGTGEPPGDLTSLDLAALMSLEITSVSRRSERLSDAAASVFVITGDEIRRSGATNLPEALRLAPNLDVVQAHATAYTVTARGFTGNGANKLLVLIDGRSVYTPLFSGVFWDVQDVLLEDIERIEVISGPGGTLWGVNAVNGVINIITRSANDTQGALLSATGGNRGTIGAFRYGAQTGSHGHLRGYAKYTDVRHSETANGTVKDDAGHRGIAGFRGDWTLGSNELTLLGNIYRGTEGQPPPGAISTGASFTLGLMTFSGANVTGLWKRQLNDDSAITVQAYFDRTERVVPPTFSERLNLFDVQFLHSWRLARIHNVAWGAEYRYGMDRVTNSPYVAFLPAHVNQKWFALFAQDEITLAKSLRVSLGIRTEHNDYTGSEFLPSARLAWNATPNHLLWTAASRTVRAPSRLDVDVFVPGGPPFILRGGPEVVSEIANVYELGYRGQPARSLTLSATAFHALYKDLRTQEIDPSRTFIFFSNGMKGRTNGVELWATYQATRRWRWSGGFTAIAQNYELEPGSNDVNGLNAQRGIDPKRSWRLRSSLDLARHSELDLVARYVSRRSFPDVPAYSAIDLRYAWHPRPGIELSVTGQNLFGEGHGELTDVSTRTEIGRAVYVGFTTRFGQGS